MRSARLKQISKSSSQIVKDAAVLLDEEIASGIVAAKQVQQRFQKERRINPTDFKDALTRFQAKLTACAWDGLTAGLVS